VSDRTVFIYISCSCSALDPTAALRTRHMKGWLTVRSGPLLLSSTRCFFRLQWGFLSQYETRRSEAMHRYCVHASSLDAYEPVRKLVLTIGPLGVLTAHGTDGPIRGAHRPAGRKLPFLRRRQRGEGETEEEDGSFHETRPTRLVLVADTVEEFRLWALLLSRGRSRPISRLFRIRETVGGGAAGDVFRATAVGEPGVEVAVKRIEYNTMRPGRAARNLRRIQKEIQTQVKAASRSPYVVRILDVFFDSRFVYLVMELVRGGSLREWLDEHRTLDEEVAISVAQQLARVLLVLHQNRIVHRDVKADNVLIDIDENGDMCGVHLTDFGFAEVCRTDDMNSFCSTFLGTASYMATEIAWFDNYGAPVDMYALGVLCFIMLTGICPFDDTAGLIATLDRIKAADKGVILQAGGISADARSFCLALTNPDPCKRLTAAAALQHRWLRRGLNVTASALTSPNMKRGGRAWFRRIFHTVTAVLALRRLAAAPCPRRPAVPAAVAAARREMLTRLDRTMHMGEPVPRQSTYFEDDDDSEVFVGDESSKALGALMR
jgi:calcium/calmodulin-dependent protein kinase I